MIIATTGRYRFRMLVALTTSNRAAEDPRQALLQPVVRAEVVKPVAAGELGEDGDVAGLRVERALGGGSEQVEAADAGSTREVNHSARSRVRRAVAMSGGLPTARLRVRSAG